LGEFDALPEISLKAKPTKSPLAAGVGRHGCGQNLFGTAGLVSAIAIKELMEKKAIKGTIKFLGTFAEKKFLGKL
jgi:aminobenzoyl-glutamate utilization protein B